MKWFFYNFRYESRLSNETVLEVCCRQNRNSTDVYLHFVDPKTDEILSYDDPIVSRRVTSENAAKNIKYVVSGDLGVQASDIHPPYQVTFKHTVVMKTFIQIYYSCHFDFNFIINIFVEFLNIGNT